MPYFDEFPTINFDLEKTGETIELTNILYRTNINESVKNNLALFLNYDFKDKDRLDIISQKLYDDSELHWLIMIMNDMVNPYYDIPVSESALSEFITSKYPGQTFFLSGINNSSSSSSGYDGFVNISGAYQTDEYVRSDTLITSGTATGGSLTHIKLDSSASSVNDTYNGAVITTDSGTGSGQTAIITDYDGETKIATTIFTSHIGCDTEYSIYVSGQVHRFDATYSRLEVDNIVGTFSAGDVITGITSGQTANLQRKIAQSKDAVHHFENSSTEEFYNPYDTTGNYLAGYILNTGSNIIENAVVTNEVYEQRLNDDKRFIRLMDPQLTSTAVSDFNRIMRSRT